MFLSRLKKQKRCCIRDKEKNDCVCVTEKINVLCVWQSSCVCIRIWPKKKSAGKWTTLWAVPSLKKK